MAVWPLGVSHKLTLCGDTPNSAAPPGKHENLDLTPARGQRIFERNAAISWHFERDSIPYALETDWPVGAAGLEPLHIRIGICEDSQPWGAGLELAHLELKVPRGRVNKRTGGPVLRCARVRVAGASTVDVERPSGALDDLPRDHHLFDPFETRQVEHGVEQDALHDRAQAASASLAVDRLAGNGAQRSSARREIDRFYLEQALILLDQRLLGLGEK